jgi:hypothetical protein
MTHGPGDWRLDEPFAGRFQAGFLHVSPPETKRFDKALEAYIKVAEKKSRTKQVLVFG